MEEIFDAIKLALEEEGFHVIKDFIGRNRYLMIDGAHKVMIRIYNDNFHINGGARLLIPLAHPDSIQMLINHLTEELGLAIA